MKDCAEKILNHCWAGSGMETDEIFMRLADKLVAFCRHPEKQVTELLEILETFPDVTRENRAKLRAWLIMAYDDRFLYDVPSKNALDDVMAAVEAWDTYGDEYSGWCEKKQEAKTNGKRTK